MFDPLDPAMAQSADTYYEQGARGELGGDAEAESKASLFDKYASAPQRTKDCVNDEFFADYGEDILAAMEDAKALPVELKAYLKLWYAKLERTFGEK